MTAEKHEGGIRRDTENRLGGAASHGRNPEGHGRRANAVNNSENLGGRPKGSKNRPKMLVPKEMANAILLAMKDTLPPEHLEYMKGVIREGKAISTKRELETLILLLSRNLMPVLVEETIPKKDSEGNTLPAEFRKDVTERLKVLSSMLGLRHQVEKRDEPTDKDQPILQIFARRGIDPRRIAVLIDQPGSMDRGTDGTRFLSDGLGTIPDSILERQVEIQDSEQVEADWILDGDFSGDGSERVHEGELQS